MNVAFDPWIPVVTATGARELASLVSVLAQGKKYADLAVRPHERVALMRLFLCVAHAALDGPKDYDEWCAVSKRLPEAVGKYLAEWKDSFELFHPTKPWLQVEGLTKTKNQSASTSDISDWTPVSKLNFSFATGNASTLFDHEGMSSNDRNIPLHETLISLVTFQCFSVGGLIGQVFWCGSRCGELANPKTENGPVKSSDGPCVPASMVHAFLRGNSLDDTIHLNLPTYSDIRLSYGEREIGRPIWELMPVSLADADRITNATTTYVGRLVPLTRLIKLHPSKTHMLIGDGFSYPSFVAGFPQEPTATVVIRNDERSLLSYRPSKALWRELSSIVVKRKAGEPGGPMSLNAIQEGERCDLVVAALARDKATIVDTVEAVFHLPANLACSAGAMTYDAEVKIAEALASRLGWAVEDYRKEVDGGWEGRLKGAGPSKAELKVKLHSIATTHYWTTVEKNLAVLMTHIESIDSDDASITRDAWRKMIFAAACDSYRIACGQETPRQMKAFAKGWQKLTSTKDEPEAETNKTTEENP